ncbi:hypothetical protein CRE_20559 [Caenorhabditis remanei]|uniref:Uncharacterized protein n=1 Tax=Caenorhabditis remanei TaxID=31234 RepID=E3NFE0_CAERE|nr:hypothetical protein CRE_20559 [Caenorhabditis remanei]
MSISSTPSSPSICGSSISSSATNISFCYTWTTKLKTRKTADGETTILSISPKFATVHQLISFQWNIRIHATSEMNDDDEEVDYVAVDLYFVDGPVNEVNVMAEVGALEKTSTATLGSIPAGVKETKLTKMQKGVGCEITDSDRECVSRYLKENVENVIKISIIINMETRLFEPSTYLDAVSPTPRASFLTANYNARVNSKVWKRRSKKRMGRVERRVLSDKEKTSYERKVQMILDEEREKLMERRELLKKKDIGTCLLLDLLFNSIVFNLPVMKSMTLTELANRTHEFVEPDSLLDQEEYKNLDKRMRNLADRNLVEIIEQCVTFRDQKARVRVLPTADSFDNNNPFDMAIANSNSNQ